MLFQTVSVHKKPGFTLIEVIIAITVFSIGVLAVLNLIMYNLSTIDKVQTKITATILAKE
jgi:prepilin-type N-terminal cleavage/methylation domain-containing protein